MSADEIDRVTQLALLMRAAYPGRSEAYCIERAGLCIADIAAAHAEYLTAIDVWVSSRLEDAGGRHGAVCDLRRSLTDLWKSHLEAVCHG